MADTTVSTPTGAAPGAPQISTAPAGKAAPTSARASTTRMARIPNDENEAIVNCMKAWNYAYKKAADDLDEDENDYPAQKAGNKAYLNAAPPLSGLENICDFIACINYASMRGVVTHTDATHYMANARIALAALSLRPKPQATGAKSGGKAEANLPKGEKE